MLCAGCAETTEDRRGAVLLLQMRLDRARDADRAEQERDEPDEIEEAVKILERRAEILLPLLDGVVLEAEPLNLRRDRFRSACSTSVPAGNFT